MHRTPACSHRAFFPRPDLLRLLILCVLLLFSTAPALFPAPALAFDRTYDTLTPEENAELSRLEERCLKAVRDDALQLLTARFDVHTILRTFTDQIRIIRQRHRALFLDVERYLYSLRLNPEFIDSYMFNLREDSVMGGLDALLLKSRGRTQ